MYYLTKDELYHHGIKGQKWGQRRFQNEDGTLTAAGREHYGYGAKAAYKERVGIAKANYKKALIKSVKSNSDSKGNMTKAQIKKFDEESKKLGKQLAEEKKAAKQEYKNSDEYKARQEKIKKAVKVGAAVAATALVAYGTYKVVNGKIQDQRAMNALYEGEKRAKDLYNFNAPFTTISRQSHLTGKSYYNIKNIYGESIQKGVAKSPTDVQKIREMLTLDADLQKSRNLRSARSQYLDYLKNKNRKRK